VAIHWDYAREVLQKANGVIATVGLEADLPQEAPAAAESPAADQPHNGAPSPGAAPPESPAPAAPASVSPAPLTPEPISPTARDH
jgi:hypothetical protein